MNKICVIAKNEKTIFIQRLRSHLGNCYESFNPWEENQIPQADFYFVRTSSVYGDDRDLEILSRLDPEKVINPLPMLKLCRSKLSQYQKFPEASPLFMDLRNSTFENAREFFMGKLRAKAVVKPHRGQGGWGVKILEGDEFQAWWESHEDREYLLQEYVRGDEVRIFFIQDQLFGLRRRGEAGVANFALGGGAEPYEISSEVASIVKDIIQKTGAHYGAFDFILKERPYLLELNSVPGIEQIEKALDVDLISLLLASLPSKVARKLKF